MIVVSDTSALIALSTVNQLDILRVLYGEIVIPEAVFAEVVIAGASRPGAQEILAADWITKQSVKNAKAVEHLSLGMGETEAIALFLELKADLLLLDEVKARREARQLGVKYIGILGVLIEAKANGHIREVKPILDQLESKAGFRISRSLYDHVLRAVDEK